MSKRTATIWTFAITSVALFMATLDNLVVTTALPVIRADLGASIEDLEWTVNAFTLSFAVFLLTGAALGDRSRPRWRRSSSPARHRASAARS
jgi:MFS family permease